MSSSVKNLTRLFEPSLHEVEEKNESFTKRESAKNSEKLECQRHVQIGHNPADEHNDDDDVFSNDQNASQAPSSGTENSQSTNPTTSSDSRGESSPSDASNDQSPTDGDTSGSSTCQLQALQRSPPIFPPAPIRPLGNLNGNMQMFLDHSEGTESGRSRVIEGTVLLNHKLLLYESYSFILFIQK